MECRDCKALFEKHPKVKSYDVYRAVAGKPTFAQEVVYEDMKTFCSMQEKLSKPETQKVVGEFFSYIVNLETELILEIV